jgi:hypothetical protein
MMLGHAPVILPAVAGSSFASACLFYVPLFSFTPRSLVRLRRRASRSRASAGAAGNASPSPPSPRDRAGSAIAWRAGIRPPIMIVHAAMREAEPPLPAASGFALLAPGFRPFYLLRERLRRAVDSALGAAVLGLLRPAVPRRAGLARARDAVRLHARRHRRLPLHGGRNWTGRPTPAGWPLAALVLLWIAARVLVLTPYARRRRGRERRLPARRGDGLAIPFVQAGNRRNYFFVGLLCCFAVAAAFVHLAQLGLVACPPVSASRSRSTSCSSSSP